MNQLTCARRSLLLLAAFLFSGLTSALEPTLKDVAYDEADPAQRLDVYRARSDTPRPVMVFIHGGGWQAGSKAHIPGFLAAAVSEGWLSVVSVEYRFSQVATHPAQVNDSLRAIQFVRSRAKEWGIDASRLGVTGGSAGAHLSLWAALHDDAADPGSDDPVARESSRVTCAIGFAGPTDWSLLADIPHGHPAYRQLLGYAPGTPADAMREDLKTSVSPITYASADDPPVLIVHGDADDIVPIQHAQRLYERLQACKAKPELLVIPGTRHEIAGAGHPEAVARSVAFIREHLGIPARVPAN